MLPENISHFFEYQLHCPLKMSGTQFSFNHDYETVSLSPVPNKRSYSSYGTDLPILLHRNDSIFKLFCEKSLLHGYEDICPQLHIVRVIYMHIGYFNNIKKDFSGSNIPGSYEIFVISWLNSRRNLVLVIYFWFFGINR